MALFYFAKNSEKNSSSLSKILENESDQQYYPSSDVCDIVTVSAEDFKKIKTNEWQITGYDGTNLSFEQPTVNSNVPEDTQEILERHINSLIKDITVWLTNNPSHAKKTEWENYKNYLNSLDYSSITFPINKTWERYCEDNSIAYKNLLELPNK